jgi:hypothetical protein
LWSESRAYFRKITVFEKWELHPAKVQAEHSHRKKLAPGEVPSRPTKRRRNKLQGRIANFRAAIFQMSYYFRCANTDFDIVLLDI